MGKRRSAVVAELRRNRPLCTAAPWGPDDGATLAAGHRPAPTTGARPRRMPDDRGLCPKEELE